MARVPIVEREVGCECHAAALGVGEAALEVFLRHGFEKIHQARVNAGEKSSDGSRAIRESGRRAQAASS